MFEEGAKVGLYFDGRCVYVAELHKRSGQVRVSGFAQAEVFSPPWVPPEPATIVQTIQQTLRQAGVQSKAVATALPGRDSVIRYFEMPLLPKKEWANAIRFEAHKYMPFDTKDLYFGFDVLPEAPLKKMKVIFFAVKKQSADHLIRLISDAGLTIQAIEPGFVSLFRAYNFERLHKAGGGEAYAVVGIDDDDNLNVAVTKSGLLLISQDSIVLRPSGGAEPSKANVAFETFLTEIRLTLNYFSKSFKGEEVRRMVLCADVTERFKDWDQMLRQELGIPVEIGHAVGQADQTKPVSSGMAIACGLAARRYSEEKRGLNLELIRKSARTAPSAPPPAVEEKKLFQKWILMELVVMAVGLFFVYYLMTTKVNSTQRAVHQARIAHPQTISATSSMPLDELHKKESDLNRRLSFLTSLVDQRVYWTSKMNEIAKTVPENVQLTLLEYADDEDAGGRSSLSLKIEGDLFLNEPGNELEAVNRFVDALKQNQEFMREMGEIKINSLHKVAMRDRAGVHFTLECAGIPKQGA